jgi:hypothetical protein
VDIYVDDFTIYGDTYEEGLANLKNVLQNFQNMNLSIINEKLFMMMNKGLVIGHYISVLGVEVDLAKNFVIK